jgi:hypothetical protein
VAIKSDIRNLPSAKRTNDWPGPFRLALGAWLKEQRAAEGEREMATTEARLRHSDAGRCSRHLFYKIAGVPVSDEINAESLFTFAMGDRAHEILQAAVERHFTELGATVTHEVVLPAGVRAGHADTCIEFPTPTALVWGDQVYEVRKVLVEFKSTGGYSFSKCVKEEGPKSEAYLQGALNAEAWGADLLVMVYVALDRQNRMADQVYGKGRLDLDATMAEWVYTAAEFGPDARAEAARMEAVLDTDGVHAPRATFPGYGPSTFIANPTHTPSHGMWVTTGPDGGVVESGTVWQCGYCPFRGRCADEMAADGPGVVAA